MMQTPNTYRGGPDPRGHFGIYGGRYVAETLMPLILAVEQAYNAARDDPNFHAELAYYLDHYVGRPSPLVFRRAADPAFRRRQALFQTRRAEPYRRAQDQQRARPDPAGAPHGQAPHHRRDRRRAARRRDRDRLRAVRPALRRLHGRHRYRAAEAERLPHAAARRRSRAGAFRHRDPEGRDERGAARLGRACRRHVLRDRHGGGAAPLPGDGARFPVGDRPRDARADHESRGATARYAGRLHRRRLERDGTVPPVSRRSDRSG